MGKLRAYISLIAIMSASFVTVLNTSMARVASNEIVEFLGVSFSQLTWVFNSYQLVYAVLLPVFGLLGDRGGRRRCLLWGLALFGAGSFLSGIAWNYASLVGFRIIQGLGAAAISPNTVVLATSLFPPEHRGKAMSVWSMSISLGSVTGPSIGGFIIRFLGWKYVFIINVPFAFLAAAAIFFTVKGDSKAFSSFNFDLKGTVYLATSVVSLVTVLQNIPELGIASPSVLWTLLLFLASGFLFVREEKRVSEPIIDLKMFLDKLFFAGFYSGSVYMFAVQATQFLMPLFLTQVLGMDALAMGIFMMPQALVRLVVSPFSGILDDKYTAKVPVGIGLLAKIIALTALAFATRESPKILLTFALMLDGVGAAMISAPAMNAVLKKSPQDKSASIAGAYEMVRFIAGVVGIVLVGTLLDQRYRIGFPSNRPVPGYFESYLVLSVLTALGLPLVKSFAEKEPLSVDGESPGEIGVD